MPGTAHHTIVITSHGLLRDVIVRFPARLAGFSCLPRGTIRSLQAFRTACKAARLRAFGRATPVMKTPDIQGDAGSEQ